MCVFSSTKSAHLQHKTCLSLALNMFVCSVLSYSDVSTGGYISLLVMEVFVCSVTLYLEVKQLVFECFLEVPPKRTESSQNGFEKTTFEVGPERKIV